MVHGRSGMGKTALVRQFLADVQSRCDAVILQGRCYERESVPYKALDTIVDALSNYLLRLSSAEIGPLIPRDIVPLSRLFPVLRRVRAIAEPEVRSFEPPDPQESRRRAFGALRYMLKTLAADKPVILFIDDLQWGDLDSAAFLADIIHHPHPPAVLLVTSYRREDADSPLVQSLSRPSAAARGDLRELAVDELTDEEARAVVEDILELEGHGDAAPISDIVSESGRNPFFLAELAYAAAEREHGEVVSLDELLSRRLDRLPGDARALLIACAVAGRPVPLLVAARAAQLTDETPALGRLRAVRLVRTRKVEGRFEVETYHDRIRAVALASLSEDQSKDVHRALAQALEKSDRSDLQSLIDHYLGAGDRKKAGRYAARAAVQAERALAFNRAAHCFALALELQDLSDDKRRARQRRMADALANAGRLLDAADAYLVAAEGADPDLSLELRRNAVEQLLYGGKLEQGLELTKSVVAEVGLRFPSSPRKALLSVAWRRLWIRLRGLGFKERKAEDIPAATLRKLDVCWSTSSGLSFVDPMLGKAYQMRHLLDALKVGEPFRIALAFSLEMGYLALAGSSTRDQVEALYKRSLELARRVGHPHAIGMCHATAGLSCYLAGEWRPAVDRIVLGEKIMRDECTGVRWEIGLAKLYHMSSLLYLGEVAELIRMVPLLLRDALESGDLYTANGLRAWRTNVTWLAMDSPDEASALADAGALESARDDFHLHHYYELLTRAQIELYRQNGAVAWKQVQDRWRGLQRSMLLRIQSVRVESSFLRARCALANAVAGGDREAMLREADGMARRIEKEKVRWGDPIAKLIRANAAAIRTDADTATALFSDAVAGFEIADMALLATIASRCQGATAGGDDGRARVAEADNWMSGQKIQSPATMAAMYAPGID